MEDNFKSRVDKVFGSLLGSLPSKAATAATPWTVSDAEVERKEWIQGKGSPDREDLPCSSAFFSDDRKRSSNFSRHARKRFQDDLDDLDDGDDDVGDDRREKEEQDDERDEWEVRNSIGLDSTLDNEDEEDAYDKVAIGREHDVDRLYMRDVTDYEACWNSHNILPDSFEEIRNVSRDPRANHLAAKARLQEDKNEAAGSFNSPKFLDHEIPVVEESEMKAANDGGKVKSILKRKDNQTTDSRLKKRVRFDPGCKDEQDKEHTHDFLMETQSMETTSVNETSSPLPEESPGVPDYIQNPFKYVRYTFDTSNEDDDESNLLAYQEFQNMLKASSANAEILPDYASSLPKSIVFTPRKKAGAAGADNSCKAKQDYEDGTVKEQVKRVAYPVGIAAGDGQDSEVDAMEEDDMETLKVEMGSGFRKADRQYRSKGSTDIS